MENYEIKDDDTFLIPNRPKLCYGFFHLDYFYNKKPDTENENNQNLEQQNQKQDEKPNHGFINPLDNDEI